MIKHDAAPIRSALALVLISPVMLAMLIWLAIFGLWLILREFVPATWSTVSSALRRHRIKQLCRGAK